MAKKIDKVVNHTRRNRSRYPWDQWLKPGSKWLIEPSDYSCDQQSMKQQIRQRAAERGQKVRVLNGALPGEIQVENPRSGNSRASGKPKKAR